MIFAHRRNQIFFAAAFFASPNHDRRAVRVVGTDVNAAIAPQLLESNPNVGLDVLDQMTNVNWSVGVRQGAGNQDLAWHLTLGSERGFPKSMDSEVGVSDLYQGPGL